MPAALERSQNWYKCTGSPEVRYFPTIAIDAYAKGIRKGDILTLGQVAGAPNSNRCLQAVATAADVHASTLILGFAMADYLYQGTTKAVDTGLVPVLMPNDRTFFRLALNQQLDGAGTNAIIGAQRELTRATVPTTAATELDGSKGYYSVSADSTDVKVEIADIDLSTWPTYPAGSSDAIPYVWVRVIPAQRVIL